MRHRERVTDVPGNCYRCARSYNPLGVHRALRSPGAEMADLRQSPETVDPSCRLEPCRRSSSRSLQRHGGWRPNAGRPNGTRVTHHGATRSTRGIPCTWCGARWRMSRRSGGTPSTEGRRAIRRSASGRTSGSFTPACSATTFTLIIDHIRSRADQPSSIKRASRSRAEHLPPRWAVLFKVAA